MPIFDWDASEMGYQAYFVPIDEEKEFDPKCHGHSGGTVIKTHIDPDFLKTVYVFNNSWMVRAPIFQWGRASTLRHWNNAIHFAGCGIYDDPVCIKNPQLEPKCICRAMPWPCDTGLKDYFTPDGQTMFAACFNFDPPPGSLPHKFDFDAVTGSFPEILGQLGQEANGQESGVNPLFKKPETGNFEMHEKGPLQGNGCQVKVDRNGDDLTCNKVTGSVTDIGAMKADGSLFDFKFPWLK